MAQPEVDIWIGQIARFGDELRNVAFIKTVCAAFQAKALEYYDASADPTERLRRLGQITGMLRDIAFNDGDREFTISAAQVEPIAAAAAAAGAPLEVAPPNFTCKPGEVCIGGMCVPILG